VSRPADSKRSKPAQPSPEDQSGSTGRRVPEGNEPTGEDSGQDRYGQSGFSGKDTGRRENRPRKKSR
jgi:hypothetical protein